LFEEAFSDKRRFMRRLAGQFGIDAGFYDSYNFPSENQTYSVRSKALQNLNVAVRSWLPQGAFYKAARSVYRRLNTRIEATAEQPDEQLEITLAGRYQQANARLADEFNLNLEAWTAIQQSRQARQRQRAERQHVSC
jgi:arylsulfatase A-like enzyme